MAACQNRVSFPKNQSPTLSNQVGQFIVTLFDQLARALPDPMEWNTWEGRQGTALTRRERHRIGMIVDVLIELLDAADHDHEDCPVYPGSGAYVPAPDGWRDSLGCWMTNLDTDSEEGEDREQDGCDDEPDCDEDNGDTEPEALAFTNPACGGESYRTPLAALLANPRMNGGTRHG